MKRKVVALAIASLVLIGLTPAQAVTTILGTRSCGTWLAEKPANGKSTVKRYGAEAWLMGYLSGTAVATGIDFLADTDGDSIYAWVDNYCQAHPLRHLESAGTALAKELIKQKRR